MHTTFEIYKNNRVYKYPVRLEIGERITFLHAPYGLKDEIKAFKGPRWHGFDKENPRKLWSIDNCPRNVFQIKALMGEDVYAHFEQPLVDLDMSKLRDGTELHQVDMVRRGLTYRYQIFGAEQGLGKSLVGMTIAELAGGEWWYIGPKSAGESFQLEMEKWNTTANISQILTFEAAQKIVKYQSFDLPVGILVDESSGVKTQTANRTIAIQWLADAIREKFLPENSGYVILLSGTPTAKRPSDIWSQAEIAWPGFLREGSTKAFQQRYAIVEEREDMDGIKYPVLKGWRAEEVAELPNRLQGLMTVYRKADCLNLPKKNFRQVVLQPSEKVLRVGRALSKIAPNTITALGWLRALSSGFQYVMKEDGKIPCPACLPGVPCHICNDTKEIPTKKRHTQMVNTPKQKALVEEITGHQRIVVAASFKGSIERCRKAALELGYATCVIDGDGWVSYDVHGELMKGVHPLRHWKDCPDPVCLIGNPASCRFGITLIEAKKMVFFDNSFSAEHRLQMIDRIHRIGQTEPVEYVDLIHLPVDQLVVDTLDNNRELELLSLGAIRESLGDGEDEDISELLLENSVDTFES